MSEDIKTRITLLGNNSGRNLGDASILASILAEFSQKVPDAEFLVPSMAPDFIDRHYSNQFKIKSVDVRLKTFSLRLLGLPTLKAIARSHVAMICDGIIFGHKLFSPHNFLITLIFLAPWAKLMRCNLICLCCGIGPFPSRLSEMFARYVLNSCDAIIMRDEASKELARSIGVTKPISISGDIAFLNYISSEERACEILSDHSLDLSRPLIGFNVTAYRDSWLKADERLNNDQDLVPIVAEAFREFVNQVKTTQGETPQVVLFSCSPMDEPLTKELAAQLDQAAIIDNTNYLSHDIQAVMRMCRLLIGMRFHSLVLAAGAGAPIVGLIYAPKVRDLFKLMSCEEYSLELKELSPSRLVELILKAWNGSEELKVRQQKVIEELKSAARKTTEEVSEEFLL